MISILPGGFAGVVNADLPAIAQDPGRLGALLFELLFVIDVQIGTVGYLLTMRPLDAHIRSGNPFLAGWVAALVCYPPFVFGIISNDGVIGYEYNTADWAYWMQGHTTADVDLGRMAGVSHGFLCLGDGRLRDALLEPHLSRRADQRAVPLHPPPGLSVEEPVLVVLDHAVLRHQRLAGRYGAQHLLPRPASARSTTGARGPKRRICSREDPKYREYHAWMGEHGLITSRMRKLLGKLQRRPPVALQPAE